MSAGHAFLPTSFANLSNGDLGYFVGLDARGESPEMTLAGDRRTEFIGRSVAPGLHHRPASVPLVWTMRIHPGRGGLLRVDGSASLAGTSRAAGFRGSLRLGRGKSPYFG